MPTHVTTWTDFTTSKGIEMTDFKPGWYTDVPEQDYLSGKFGPTEGSLSASGIKTLLKSPKLFKHQQANPWEGSDATRLGTVVHELLLGSGPGFVVVPPNGRKQAEREAHHGAIAEAVEAGKAYVTEEQYAHALEAEKAVWADPDASRLLSAAGEAELSAYAVDDSTELWRRCRFDYMRDDNLGVDIKTARSAAPGQFAKACHDLGYHISAAYYEAIAADLGRPLTDYAFLVVEVAPPYHVAVYRLDDDAMDLGRRRVREGLERYRDCTTTDIWPGYTVPADHTISLPGWAYKESA